MFAYRYDIRKRGIVANKLLTTVGAIARLEAGRHLLGEGAYSNKTTAAVAAAVHVET